MNKVRASMTLVLLLGAGLASFAGCTADPPPPDNTGGSGGAGGSGGGIPINCGDGKLDMNEACDDGNNAPNDGCTGCAIDECYDCTAVPDNLSTCGFAAAATACQATKVCDGAGKCVECIDDMQCTGGYCFNNTCAKCDDTTKNGDETDVDCGGTHCGKCADGKACGVTDDCNSTFCTDGVCCGELCDAPCLACNLTGSLGVCDFIAKYDQDTNAGASTCATADGKACNGAGFCSGALGTMCNGPTQCASGKCADPAGGMNKVCVKNTGEDCTMDAECFSNVCDTGTMKCM